MAERAFQDTYAENSSHCYGCGRLNEHGLQIKSYWDGEHTVCTFEPRAYHTGMPGFAYGGLIASVIDCHSTGSAMAAALRAEARELGSQPPIRFVTAALHVDYLKPTPIEGPFELRSTIQQVTPRKVVLSTELRVRGELCARGEVVAVRLPDEPAAAP